MAIFSWSLFVALCCSFLASVVYGQYVAPGDDDPSCFDSVRRVPVPPQQKILVDTQNYEDQTLLDTLGGTERWVSGNFDGLETSGVNYNWRDSSQTALCIHQLLACDPENQPQNNWLITQFINITDENVEQLVVNMTFTTGASSCPQCQQSFSMQVYETNTLDEIGRVNQTFYQDTNTRFFHREDDKQTESALDSFTISSKGLYLAVVDTGSCTRISRLYLFYYVCPTQVVNMIQYPETVSPPTTNPQDRSAVGTCIDNASPIDGAVLDLDCSINGNWENNELGCSCDPGYEIIMGSCEGCSEGEYKLVQGNEDCVECPVNSNSSSLGASICDCNPGYYRSTNENAAVQCTAPPTAPNNVETPTVEPTSIQITWAPPTDNGGRNDVFYTVAYSNDTYTSTLVIVGNSTQHTLTDLTPSNQYTITVATNNGVSDQDPDTAARAVTINVTTPSRGPTPPMGVALSSHNDLILQWTPPTFLYGIFSHYNILVATEDDPLGATVRGTTTDTTFDLSTLDLSAGVYFVWVQAVTDNGEGDLSDSVRHVEVDEASNVIVAVVGGAVGGVVFLLLLAILIAVLIIVIFSYRNKKEKYVPASTNVGHHPELELGVLPITDEDTSNRMYVDPRNYSSLNQAFDETGVKEIPPKEITNLDEIGVGEFGLVYRGTWTLRNVKVAVKTLRGGATDEQKRNFLFEASVMAQFQHPNVVKLYGIISRIDPIMIIMEYMDNGSLDRYLQKHLDKLGLQRQLKISYDVAVGMSYLSKIGFVHRDLAARNILVTNEEAAKVADFGLAREMVENEYGVQRGGRIPVRWTAPEAISHRSFTTASDVWSFGVLLWEIMTYGETPYGEWDNYAVFNRLEEGERLKQPRYCPDDVYQLMLLCWEQERSERPSFDSICEGLEIMIHGKPKPKPKPQHLKGTSLSPPPSSPKPISQPIDEFLKSIAMSKYIDLFQQHRLLTVEDCYKLEEDDLERMGVTLGGHQHKIIKNIKIRQEEVGTSY